MRLLLRRSFLALVAVLLVVTVWTAVALLSVRDEVRSAQRALVAAREAADVDATRAPLERARMHLETVDSRLAQPGPRLAAVLPMAGRSVSAVRTTTHALLAVTRAGQDLLDAAPEAFQDGNRIDVTALRSLSTAAARGAEQTRKPVERLHDLELDLVPAPIARPARAARAALAAAPEQLAQSAAALWGLSGVLGADEPRSLLVMLQNNAELRGTGGLVTVFATATARDGRVEIGAFRDVEDVADARGAVVEVAAPHDYVDLWGPFLANSTLWVNVNMTPDVPTASSVLADVAVASGLPRPDAVVWLDVPAIAALLGATGPIQLPDGTRLDQDNAVRVLLSEAYDSAVDTREGQALRRAALRAAADAVLSSLLTSSGAPAPSSRLAGALREAAAGRHVALWSSDEREQRALVTGGVAGEVRAEGGDVSSMAVQNFGGGDGEGNKLDFYARRQVTIDVALGEDEAVVEQELALRNTAPAQGLPQYVAGLVDPGVSRNYVVLALPADARGVELQRGSLRLQVTPVPSRDHAVVRDGLALPPGATATWTLRYRLPVRDGQYVLRLFPQPLAVDAGLSVRIRTVDGRRLRGAGAADGTLTLSGPFDARAVVAVQAEEPGLLARATAALRRFWTEPVRLPS